MGQFKPNTANIWQENASVGMAYHYDSSSDTWVRPNTCPGPSEATDVGSKPMAPIGHKPSPPVIDGWGDPNLLNEVSPSEGWRNLAGMAKPHLRSTNWRPYKKDSNTNLHKKGPCSSKSSNSGIKGQQV